MKIMSIFKPINPLPKNWQKTWPKFIIFFILLSIVYCFALTMSKFAQHFVFLADSFLKGSVHFLAFPPEFSKDILTMDMIEVNGKYFWPQGPFPAIVLMPIVAIANLLQFKINQLPVITALAVLTFICVLWTARREKYSPHDAIWWGLAFCFGSMYLGVIGIPTSYSFAHVIVVILLWLAIMESLSHNRAWLIGIIFGAILATRFTAVIGVMFFLLQNFLDPQLRTQNWKRTIQTLSPLLVSGLLLGWYNFSRFGNFFDSGYNAQYLFFPPLKMAISYGIFGIIHLPGNLYHALLAMPSPVFADNISHVLHFPFILPNQWGMSIFLTSPYLLILLIIKYRDKWSRALLFTITATALPIFLYYGIGVIQFGYRYALDFFPLLFWLLLRQYRLQHDDISRGLRFAITAGIFLNLWLFIGGSLSGVF